MASQVYSGTGNFTYTNSTGQNVRLIINYYSNPNSAETLGFRVSWSTATTATSPAFAFGKNIAHGRIGLSVGGESQNMLPSPLTVQNYTSLPTEVMLASGDTFSVSAYNLTNPSANATGTLGSYNIVVIKEDGT